MGAALPRRAAPPPALAGSPTSGSGSRPARRCAPCALATRLARSLDLPEEDARAAFYTALLHHVGCIGYAHETPRLFGDELALNVAAGRTDTADPGELFATFLPTLLRGRPPLERAHLAHLRDPAMVAAIVRRLVPP